MKFTITTKDGHVYAQITGQPKAEIYAETECDFFYTVVNARISFGRNEAGLIDKLTLFQGGRQLVANKETQK